ncbi:restriction endonuclease subunit M [Helicobacter pylori]|nr:restriction endonuclease subunit M [Helicobacter pylori]
MTFKRVIIAYLPHKRMGNTGNKNNILCYNETFKWCAKNANQNTKKGAYYHGKQQHSSR